MFVGVHRFLLPVCLSCLYLTRHSRVVSLLNKQHNIILLSLLSVSLLTIVWGGMLTERIKLRDKFAFVDNCYYKIMTMCRESFQPVLLKQKQNKTLPISSISCSHATQTQTVSFLSTCDICLFLNKSCNKSKICPHPCLFLLYLSSSPPYSCTILKTTNVIKLITVKSLQRITT